MLQHSVVVFFSQPRLHLYISFYGEHKVINEKFILFLLIILSQSDSQWPSLGLFFLYSKLNYLFYSNMQHATCLLSCPWLYSPTSGNALLLSSVFCDSDIILDPIQMSNCSFFAQYFVTHYSLSCLLLCLPSLSPQHNQGFFLFTEIPVPKTVH